MDKSRVIERLRSLEASRGRPFSLDEFCAEAGISHSSVQRLFGGWRKLRAAAGLSVVRRSVNVVFSQAMLVERLKTVAGEKGSGVSLQAFCQVAGVSADTVHRYCGSWQQLRKAAGLGPADRKRQPVVPTVVLLHDVHLIVEKLGYFPSLRELDALSGFGSRTYLRRFGTLFGAARKYWAMRPQLIRALRLAQEMLRREQSERSQQTRADGTV